MRDRERADLPQDGAGAAAQQVDAEHEQHVIESVGHDVGEAEPEIAPGGAESIDRAARDVKANGALVWSPSSHWVAGFSDAPLRTVMA